MHQEAGRYSTKETVERFKRRERLNNIIRMIQITKSNSCKSLVCTNKRPLECISFVITGDIDKCQKYLCEDDLCHEYNRKVETGMAMAIKASANVNRLERELIIEQNYFTCKIKSTEKYLDLLIKDGYNRANGDNEHKGGDTIAEEKGSK